MFEKILSQQFLSNTVKSYLIVMGVILLAFFFKRIFSKYLAYLVIKIASGNKRSFNKERFKNLVLRPIEVFVMIAVAMIALGTLNYPSIFDFKIHKTPLHTVLEGITNTIAILSFMWICIRFLRYIAEVLHERAQVTNDHTQDQLIIFFKDFFKAIIWIIGILLIIRFGFGKPIGDVLTGLSLVGAALALAFRESMENLIASFIIFFDKPFTVGDTVKVQSITGTVEKIGLRSTRIRTTDKTYVTVPNKQMVDTIIDNQSLRTKQKIELKLDVSVNTTTQQLKKLIDAVSNILKKEVIENPVVFLSNTGSRSHTISIEYYVDASMDSTTLQQIRQNVNMELIEAFNTHHIDMAADKSEIIIRDHPADSNQPSAEKGIL